ncbi:MAG: MmgE/PrpD family protein [Betaproteobacteria bacterium]|nr:MmgE/PrpD family protein [Betaproteobacteria bacterium]
MSTTPLDGAALASARLADFAAALEFEAIPLEVVQAASDHLLDAIGVGLAAASLPAADKYAAALRELGEGDDATVLGLPGRWPAASAALHNGTLIHSLEFDDTHIASVVHGSSVLAAAALAVAEKSKASGRDLLKAYVVGWEAFIRLGLAAPGLFQPRGFQLTAVGGSSIAALVSSMLLGLDPASTRHALGITASQMSGTFEPLADGSASKALNPGWAAHGGVVAALLAKSGMTGPMTVYEGRFGLYGAFAGDASLGERYVALLRSLGTRWHLPEAALKAYPCCHYIHPFLECADALRMELAARGVLAENIAQITCTGPAGYETVICDPWARKQRPSNGYDAKFSLPYCVSAALSGATIDVPFFAFDTPDPRVLTLASRVMWQRDDEADFPRCFPARVDLQIAGGSVLGRAVDDVFGSPARRMPHEQLIAKFRGNAVLSLTADGVERVLSQLERIAEMPDVRVLGDTLIAA